MIPDVANSGTRDTRVHAELGKGDGKVQTTRARVGIDNEDGHCPFGLWLGPDLHRIERSLVLDTAPLGIAPSVRLPSSGRRPAPDESAGMAGPALIDLDRLAIGDDAPDAVKEARVQQVQAEHERRGDHHPGTKVRAIPGE